MNRLPQQPDLTPTALFNPSLEHFTFVYDKKEYLLPSYGIEIFPKYLADRLASRLADTILSKQGVRRSREEDREDILREIYVI